MQDGVLHIHRHTARSHLVLRYLTLHLHAFHHIGLWLQGNDADIAYADVALYRFIADIRHLQSDALSLAGNHEIAVLIAHTAIDKTLVVQRDVDEFDGLSAFIHNMTYHLRVLLLGTLNEDLVVIVGHLHRIEADYFADGLIDRQVGEMAGHGEVFQFVVDEIDGLVAGGSVEVFKHF